MKKNNLAFISYRREDEGAATRFLKAYLDKIFGPEQIFMDVESIRIGKKWANEINEHLLKATVLIVIIGKNWLRLQDEFFRRRIDNENDWVRKEIEISIKNKIKIIPVYLGTDVVKQGALPPSINSLTSYQSLTLNATNWWESLKKLISIMEKNGFQLTEDSEVYPVISAKDRITKNFPLALTDKEVLNALKKIPKWKITNYVVSGESKTVIERTYKFGEFEDVIEFMSAVSKHISKVQHHPEWENKFKTLKVKLTTWDIGHKVSYLDIGMAKYMDREFGRFKKRKFN